MARERAAAATDAAFLDASGIRPDLKTGSVFELTRRMAWDGRERRKRGRGEELRARIVKLQHDWEAQQPRQRSMRPTASRPSETSVRKKEK
jgi:hypothetical protein